MSKGDRCFLAAGLSVLLLVSALAVLTPAPVIAADAIASSGIAGGGNSPGLQPPCMGSGNGGGNPSVNGDDDSPGETTSDRGLPAMGARTAAEQHQLALLWRLLSFWFNSQIWVRF
jgi:hypothetical protein